MAGFFLSWFPSSQFVLYGDTSLNCQRQGLDLNMFPTVALLSYALLSLASFARAGATYNLNSNVVGSDFYSAFSFQAIADPTNGRVYVSLLLLNNNNFISHNLYTYNYRCDVGSCCFSVCDLSVYILLDPHMYMDESVCVSLNVQIRQNFLFEKKRSLRAYPEM